MNEFKRSAFRSAQIEWATFIFCHFKNNFNNEDDRTWKSTTTRLLSFTLNYNDISIKVKELLYMCRFGHFTWFGHFQPLKSTMRRLTTIFPFKSLKKKRLIFHRILKLCAFWNKPRIWRRLKCVLFYATLHFLAEWYFNWFEFPFINLRLSMTFSCWFLCTYFPCWFRIFNLLFRSIYPFLSSPLRAFSYSICQRAPRFFIRFFRSFSHIDLHQIYVQTAFHVIKSDLIRSEVWCRSVRARWKKKANNIPVTGAKFMKEWCK